MVIAGDDVLDAELNELEPASRDGAINVMAVFFMFCQPEFPSNGQVSILSSMVPLLYR